MARTRLGLALGLVVPWALIACSPKAPAPGGDSPQAPAAPAPTVAVAPTAPGAQPSPAPPPPPPDPREATLSNAVLQLLEQEHLLRPHIDDTVSRAAFASYLDRLDGSKMFLLKSDRDALAKYADKIDDEMRSGALDLAHDGAKRYAARIATVEGWVAQILAQPMNFSDEEYLETDPKKLQPANTDEELRDRWRRRLELEILERVTTMEASLEKKAGSGSASGSAGSGSAAGPDPAILKIPPTPEGREAKAREELARAYAARFARLKSPAPLEAASDLLNAVTSSLDPHTDYLPPADKANFDIAMTGSLEGIGAVLREKDHLIEISELVPGGASFRQGGLTPGDLILSVVPSEGKEAVDVYDMPIEDVVHMIRGPKGTVVRLRVQKASGETATIAITRDVVIIESAYARGAVLQKKGKPAYGYILLPSFYGGQGPNQRTAAGDVGKLLEELKAKKVAGIIIDIRGNGGGLLTDAVKMTGELVDTGPVVQVQDSRGKRQTLSDDDKGELWDGPVIVMVDQFSASASEIVAAALQDYHRAVIVGTGPTHGKGTVQTVIDIDRVTGSQAELGSLKLTIEQFFRITGGSTQREGVTPDVVLPNPTGYVDTGERTLDHAIAWSHVDPAAHQDWKQAWKPGDLVAKSMARVAKNPLLSKIAAATAVLRARRDDTKVPLQRTAWLARRDAQKAAMDAASPELDKAPAQFAVAPIADSAAAAPAPAPAPARAGETKPVDPNVRWRDGLARDPWVDECINIFGDLK